MSRITQPALGNSRGIPYTQAQLSKDLQVYHLATKHHPNDLYDNISNNFVQSIEAQKNPANNYSTKMKSLYMDQLDHSLNEYKNKMTRMSTQVQVFKRDYKENVNGLILYMEKEENRRNKYIQDCMKQQEARQARFVDGDKIRNEKIQNHIRNNEFATLMLRSLVMNKQNSSTNQVSSKANLLQNKSSYYKGPDSVAQHLCSPMNRTKTYQTEPLSYNNSYNVDINEKKSNSKLFRVHNPITNPIEYHIDNPYFINKLQKKFGN